MTSAGFCLTFESASSRIKRTVLQMRRTMKMMGMSVSFTSAMEEKEWAAGLLAKMGRYSERAACCVRASRVRPLKGNKEREKMCHQEHQITFTLLGRYLREIQSREKETITPFIILYHKNNKPNCRN